MNTPYIPIAFIALVLGGSIALFFIMRGESFVLPSGETIPLSDEPVRPGTSAPLETGAPTGARTSSNREVLVTDGTRHSIPLNEILSGGPGKDGIPSIDTPKFVTTDGAAFLEENDPGIGLTLGGESRFYPYRILVWHEIVNDTLADTPVLVTYCPLCATGIVFDRRVDGAPVEFGVSGMLWQSNLLMYNRAGSLENESLWSQVLGEAVLGVHTGTRLAIVPSDIVRWGEWQKLHPDTEVLSRDTGTARNYGRDPYGDYYTSASVSFGATFRDDRLHPKTLVAGIELDGQYKAYPIDTLPVGTTRDRLAGSTITIEKDDAGRLSFSANDNRIPSIPGFWFSWIAVHPNTELYQ